MIDRPVMRAVSDGIFRHQFEGFQKYPTGRDERFLEVFNEQVVSVAHARAVAESFREHMPTLQEVIDTALNLRPRFEVTASQREQWEREYGPPVPFEVKWEQKPGREIDRLWQEVMSFFRTSPYAGDKRDIQRIPIGRCWQAARELGYPMNKWQTREINDYEGLYPNSRESLPKSRESLPEPKRRITQEDFDRLPARDGKLLAAGDGEEHG